jgi:hypothetical protein
MFNRLISGITAAFGRLDSVAENVLRRLYKLYSRLAEKLDGALEKLDEVTKTLLKKYYRALEYLERLFGILRKLLRVLFPIILLFVPPAIGFLIAFFAYDIYVADSIVLATMSTVLLLILIASFRSKIEPAGETTTRRAPLAIAAELDTLGPARKVIGALIALSMLAASAYLNIGLFIGLLMFIAEVGVLYALKWIYGTAETQSFQTAS